MSNIEREIAKLLKGSEAARRLWELLGSLGETELREEIGRYELNTEGNESVLRYRLLRFSLRESGNKKVRWNKDIDEANAGTEVLTSGTEPEYVGTRPRLMREAKNRLAKGKSKQNPAKGKAKVNPLEQEPSPSWGRYEGIPQVDTEGRTPGGRVAGVGAAEARAVHGMGGVTEPAVITEIPVTTSTQTATTTTVTTTTSTTTSRGGTGLVQVGIPIDPQLYLTEELQRFFTQLVQQVASPRSPITVAAAQTTRETPQSRIPPIQKEEEETDYSGTLSASSGEEGDSERDQSTRGSMTDYEERRRSRLIEDTVQRLREEQRQRAAMKANREGIRRTTSYRERSGEIESTPRREDVLRLRKRSSLTERDIRRSVTPRRVRIQNTEPSSDSESPAGSESSEEEDTGFLNICTRRRNRQRERREYAERRRPESKAAKHLKNWGIKFANDGKDDPQEYLDDIEACKRAERLYDEDILDALYGTLAGEAKLWYRNEQHNLESFTQFKKAFKKRFMKVATRERLEEDLRGRKQGKDEDIDTFISCLKRIISEFRRPPRIEKQIRWAARNLRKEYRHYILGKRLENLDDIVRYGREYEKILEWDEEDQNPRPAEKMVIKSAAYRPKTKGMSRVAATREREITDHSLSEEEKKKEGRKCPRRKPEAPEEGIREKHRVKSR